jgi:hypothetical protein
MADGTAPINQPNLSQNQPPQDRRVSSREYLEQLRARRNARLNTMPSQPQPQQAAPIQNQPTQEYATPNRPVSEPKTTYQPDLAPQPQQVVQEQPIESQTQQRPDTPYTPPTQNEPLSESEIFPGQVKPLPEETVLEWKAASRPFKKRNRQFYTTVGLITLLISLILFFAGQFLPIAVVVAVAFLGYVLSSVPPEMIVNKVTTYGIRNDTTLFYWDELGRFWFEERYGQNMVIVETARFPGRITLVLNSITPKEIEELLSEVLLKQKPADTFIDRSAQWIQEKIPLDVS